MAELFGAIERGLGAVLNASFEVVPSLLLAIVVVTVATRLLLLPLTVKQMRSMRVMQKIQPEMKAIQKKYKDLQKKVSTRAELQEIRLKQNAETQALFREHGANPAGGCLPLLAQMPVFIALFSVLRASVFAVALSATTATGGPLTDAAFSPEELAATTCRPTSETPAGLNLSCITSLDGQPEEQQSIRIGDLRETDGGGNLLSEEPFPSGLVAVCRPLDPDSGETGDDLQIRCTSAPGTGHLPRDGELFEAVNNDRATIVGMHPGCTPSQARSTSGLRQCTAEDDDTGFFSVLPYYLLVLLIAGTQYVSGRQMMRRSANQPAGQNPMQQQQMLMLKIMPVFFGFISLNFPVGLNTYYFSFNLWQMGQQHLTNKKLDAEEAAADGKGRPTGPKRKGLMARAREQMDHRMQARAATTPPRSEEPAEATSQPDPEPEDGKQPQGSPGKKPHPRSKKKKKKRKRKRR